MIAAVVFFKYPWHSLLETIQLRKLSYNNLYIIAVDLDWTVDTGHHNNNHTNQKINIETDKQTTVI